MRIGLGEVKRASCAPTASWLRRMLTRACHARAELIRRLGPLRWPTPTRTSRAFTSTRPTSWSAPSDGGRRRSSGWRRATTGVGRLLVSCTDRPGIVAALSQFLRDRGANILQSDQHATDPKGGASFMRTEFKLDGLEEQTRTPSSRRSPPLWRTRSAWDWGHALRVAPQARRDPRLALRPLPGRAAAARRRGELYADIPLLVPRTTPIWRPRPARFGVHFYMCRSTVTRRRRPSARCSACSAVRAT